jgi:nucleotide-binding universal stress UspA family protein
MEIKKILWPTDLSENAAVALPYVTSLSQKYRAEIHLLYVAHDLGHHEAWYGEFTTEHITKLRDWETKTAEKRLEELCLNHLGGCPLYHKHIVVGDPAEEILKTIEKEGVDIVIMASHGMKGHFPFGSVADRVVKNSPVPVLTINAFKSKK